MSFTFRPDAASCEQLLAALQARFPDFLWEKGRCEGEFYVIRHVEARVVVFAVSVGQDQLYVQHPENWDETVPASEEEQKSSPFKAEIHVVPFDEEHSTNPGWCANAAVGNPRGWWDMRAYAQNLSPLVALDKALNDLERTRRIYADVATAFPAPPTPTEPS
jgi:hypothetical protein